MYQGVCYADTKDCTEDEKTAGHIAKGSKAYNYGGSYGNCVPASTGGCIADHTLYNGVCYAGCTADHTFYQGVCYANTRTCRDAKKNIIKGEQSYISGTAGSYTACTPLVCSDNYILDAGVCYAGAVSCDISQTDDAGQTTITKGKKIYDQKGQYHNECRSSVSFSVTHLENKNRFISSQEVRKTITDAGRTPVTEKVKEATLSISSIQGESKWYISPHTSLPPSSETWLTTKPTKYIIPYFLPDGLNKLYLWVADSKGDIIAFESADFLLDTTPPAITLTRKPEKKSAKKNFFFTVDTLDKERGVSYYYCKTGGLPCNPRIVLEKQSLRVGTSSEGYHAVTFKAVDASGNESKLTYKWFREPAKPTKPTSCIALVGAEGGQKQELISNGFELLTCQQDGTWNTSIKCDAGYDNQDTSKPKECVKTPVGFYSPGEDASRYECATGLPANSLAWVGEGRGSKAECTVSCADGYHLFSVNRAQCDPYPTLSVTTQQAITNDNIKVFSVDGTCNIDGVSNVLVYDVEGNILATTDCNSSSWSVNLDLRKFRPTDVLTAHISELDIEFQLLNPDAVDTEGELEPAEFNKRRKMKQFKTFKWELPSHCHENFVFSPPLNPFTTEGFCVAKYEMKNPTGKQAVSRPRYSPLIDISRAEAIRWCQGMGSGYDLISNDQWQTVARHIESESLNWLNPEQSGKTLPQGNQTATILEASLNDQCSAGDPPSLKQQTFCPSDLRQTKENRVFVLPHGEVIWDLAGNVSEWVKDDLSLPGDATISQSMVGQNIYVNSLLLGSGLSFFKSLFGATKSYSTHAGLGYGYIRDEVGILRGGYGRISGLFTFELVHPNPNITPYNSQVRTIDTRGFRCVHPVLPPEVSQDTSQD